MKVSGLFHHKPNGKPMNLPAVIEEPQRAMTFLTPDSFEAAERIATLMTTCGTMPAHIKNKGDAFRIVVQAAKWRMDPFVVAECTSLVHGRMCFEGKLVAAVLSSMNALEGRLVYDVTGEGQDMAITVSGKVRGGRVEKLSGTVRQWRTKTLKDGKELPNNWDKDPHSQLIYRGTRQWARLYAPESIMGIYTPDEMEDARTVEGVVVASEPIPARTGTAAAPVAAPVAPTTPAAPVVPVAPSHPAIDAARALHKKLGTAGNNSEIITRLAKLHGAETPTKIQADRLDAFGKDVAEIARVAADSALVLDKLNTWENAAAQVTP